MALPLGESSALLAAVTWAVGATLFGKFVRGGTFEPAALNLVKGAVAGVAMLATVLVRGEVGALAAADGTSLWLFALSGLLGLAIGDTVYFAAMKELGVRRAMLLLSTAPVFAAVGGLVFLDEPLDLRTSLGVLLAVGGTAAVVGEAGGSAPIPGDARKGLALGLAAGILQALGALLGRKAFATGLPPLAAAGVRTWAATLALLLFSLGSGRFVRWTTPFRSRERFVPVAAIALLGSYLGIWLSQVAVAQAASVAIAATLLATPPLFALLLGRALGGEPAGARAVMGTAIAFGGVVLLTA